MSVKKHKLDLLFKVRYQNPLPAPPCPPKLLSIPTTPMRYAKPEFLSTLVGETPLPMAIDSELGMPLDLSYWECLWGDDDDSELNPDARNLPPVDSRDAFMLESIHSGPASQGASAPNVSWLRRTEYISKETSSRPTINQQELKQLSSQEIDISREAQIRDIETSFEHASDKFNLGALRHPNKPGVRAVESYEVLPDVAIWANAYDLFRFSERPGERSLDVPDTRLDCAILRPMESDGDHFLAYYLPKEDEIADDFKRRRREDNDQEETTFSFVRDYETMKIEQECPNEFLLVLDDGDGKDDAKRGKAAYYKNIERKIMLKKRRANQWDQTYADKWDAINLTLKPFDREEQEERDELLAEVTDPLYEFNRAEADAEGEVDGEGEPDDAEASHVEAPEIGHPNGFEGHRVALETKVH